MNASLSNTHRYWQCLWEWLGMNLDSMPGPGSSSYTVRSPAQLCCAHSHKPGDYLWRYSCSHEGYIYIWQRQRNKHFFEHLCLWSNISIFHYKNLLCQYCGPYTEECLDSKHEFLPTASNEILKKKKYNSWNWIPLVPLDNIFIYFPLSI